MKRVVILLVVLLGIFVSSVSAENLFHGPKVLVLNGEITGFTRVVRIDGVPTLFTNLPGVTLEVANKPDVVVAIIASA